jgi:asparagine synthase (glutamine-hydrolysing)
MAPDRNTSMCGIFGVYKPASAGVTIDRGQRCLDLLAHRGPDDRGWYDDPDVMLGHRRLTIMDLSAAGAQPMANEDGTIRITFNGEIYGFHELRKELAALGHTFVSTSDTEVVLRGYEQWGRGVLDRIDGMFAFGIWDAKRHMLLLARDRLGKKPLFVAVRDGALAFASQMRPLVASGVVDPVVRPDALREYLFLNYVVGPKTIFEGVELLPAGSWLEASSDGIRSGVHWRLADAAVVACENPQRRFEEILLDATRTRMISDAPLGVFLSGGIDSALIAAIAQSESSERRSTFSVGFDDPTYDERPKARRVAKRLGTNHHEVLCSAEDVPGILPLLVTSADHLLADQSMIPLTKLALETKRHVKVVLTGDGGDELLAGYPTYRALEAAAPYTRWVPRTLRVAAAKLGRRMLPAQTSKMSASMVAGRFLEATVGNVAEAHASWRAIWLHDEIDSLMKHRTDSTSECVAYAARMQPRMGWSRLQSAVSADVSTWLVDSILAKVDRATMSTGLEARSPLLDSRLMEFAFGTLLRDPKRNAGKQPLRRMAERMIGAELANTKKAGFQTPFAGWFAGPLRPYVRERLGRVAQLFPGVFDPDVVRRVESEHASGARNHDLKIWSLVVLAEWAALYPGVRVGAGG